MIYILLMTSFIMKSKCLDIWCHFAAHWHAPSAISDGTRSKENAHATRTSNPTHTAGF